MPGGQAVNELQNPFVLFGKVGGLHGIEADDGDDLVVGADRYRNLALYEVAHGAVEPSGPPFISNVSNDLRFSGPGDIAGKASLVGGEFGAAYPERGDMLFQPLPALGADDATLFV